LPSVEKGKLKIDLEGLPAGNYSFELYKVGYRCNDAYTTYYDLGRPNQLTKLQVEKIKKLNSGKPIEGEIIKVKADGVFTKELPLRENDVYFLNLVKL
jgi:xylan 1,4-beta-xylosidase